MLIIFLSTFERCINVSLTACKFSLWLALLQMDQKKAGSNFDATLQKPWGQWCTKHYTFTLGNIWLVMPFPHHSLQQESKSICALLISHCVTADSECVINCHFLVRRAERTPELASRQMQERSKETERRSVHLSSALTRCKEPYQSIPQASGDGKGGNKGIHTCRT